MSFLQGWNDQIAYIEPINSKAQNG